MTASIIDYNKLLAELVSGERQFPLNLNLQEQEKFLEASYENAVGPLVYSLFDEALPDKIKQTLKKESLQTSLVNEAYRLELAKLAEIFSKAEIPCVLLKGLRLAYTSYQSAELRPFCDADLLIREQDLNKALEILQELDYIESRPLMGAAIRFEHNVERPGPGETSFLLDIHWRLSSLYVVGKKLDFDSISKHLIPLSRIGPYAYGLDDAYAFIHAACHLLSQHRHSADLIWLYDIYLLLKDKSEDWFKKLNQEITSTAFAPFCAAAIRRVQTKIGLNVPEELLLNWKANKPSKESAIAADYLQSKGLWVDNIKADLRLIEGISGKVEYLKQHALPPEDFMRWQYKSDKPLPLLYLNRFLKGAWKLAKPRG